MQLKLTTAYDMKSIQDLLKSEEMLFNKNFLDSDTSMANETYTFDDIVTTNQAIDWIEQIIIPDLLNNKALANYNNYVFGDPRLRVSITKLAEKDNKYSFTKDVFPHYVYGGYRDANYIFSDEIQNQSKYDAFEYKKLNDKDSPNFRGGYIIDFSGTQSEINLKFEEMKTFIQDSPSWAVIFLELLHYNRNTEMVVKNDIIFTRVPTGYIIPSYKTQAIRYFYQSAVDYFRGVLECLFLIIASIYFTRTMNRWYIKGKIYTKKKFDNQSARLKNNK